MEQFLEKFGIFDIFCMLIPGAMFVMGMAFLFPNAEEYIPDILTDGVIKYFSLQFAPSGGRKCVFQRPLCGAERPLVFS